MNARLPAADGGPARHPAVGPLVTLVAAVVLESINREVTQIPNSETILLLSVAYAAYRGGQRYGAISATISSGYIAMLYSQPEQLFRYTSRNLRVVFIESVSAFIMAAMVGLLRRRQQREFEELQALDEMRANLVSMLAHDVRGPLGVIQGFAMTLLERDERIDAPTRRKLLEAVDHQTKRLVHLSSDLLDLARMEQGRLEVAIHDVPLAAALREAVELTDDPERISIGIDPSIHVLADPDRLAQIADNLLSNAIRHGASPIEISAEVVDGSVRICFSDHGPGVPMTTRAHLFQPFTVTRSGSIGLGLSIVKILTEAQGGSVSYADRAPHGATFIVTLPLADMAAQTGTAS